MFDFMLDAATSIRQVPYETLADKFAVGGEVTLRGMGTVFAVLIMIWGMVEFLHLILGEKKKSSKKAKIKAAHIEEKAVEEAPAPAPAPAPATIADDYELIAVITAAIAAASGSSPNSFRVVSFKRANNKFAGK